MNREELAQVLWQAAHPEGDLESRWPEIADAYRDALFLQADAMLAVVCEAVRDAYREGAIDTVNASGQVNSFTGEQFAEMAYDEGARWEISDARNKWGQP